jgi:L-iduronidase
MSKFGSFVDESGTPCYNFTFLDQLLDWLQIYRLSPGFELMGNPSNFFNDFSNDTQVNMWRDLVMQIASRYIGRLNSRLLYVIN